MIKTKREKEQKPLFEEVEEIPETTKKPKQIKKDIPMWQEKYTPKYNEEEKKKYKITEKEIDEQINKVHGLVSREGATLILINRKRMEEKYNKL